MRYRMTDPFWAFFGRVLVKPLVIAGLAAALLFETYSLLTPAESRLASRRQKMAEHICSQVVTDLPKREDAPSVAVLTIAGDANGLLGGLLREKIQAAGKYRLLEHSFLDKLLREFGKQDAPVSRLADAVATARQIGVDLVIFGEISEFKVEGNDSRLTLEMRMADRQSGQAVFARSYSGGTPGPGSSWGARLVDSPATRRIFIWVAFTLLLPVVSIPLIRRLTAMDSNLLNLAMLLGYTVADMFLALLLMGFGIASFWTVLILIVALVASIWYNYSIASFIEEMGH